MAPINVDPFGRLSDELVVLVLKQAAEAATFYHEYEMEIEGESGPPGMWVSAQKLFNLRAVCRRFKSSAHRRRFKRLLQAPATSMVSWSFEEVADREMAAARCIEFTNAAGADLKGLKLVSEYTADGGTGTVSTSFLTALLLQATCLESIILYINSSDATPQRGCQLLTMLASLPLKVLVLNQGFRFAAPLSHSQQFRYLTKLSLSQGRADASFIQSLLGASPSLRYFELSMCRGFEDLVIHSPSLERFEFSSSCSEPAISLKLATAKLTQLWVHSLNVTLVLMTPSLISLTIEEPCQEFDIVGPCLLEELKIGQGVWDLAYISLLCDLAKRKGQLRSLEVGSSVELVLADDGLAPDTSLSSFLGHLRQSLKELRLRTVFPSFLLADNCKTTLLTLTPFCILEEIELDIERVEQFRVLRAFLDVCPALTRLTIHIDYIETPVHNLLQEVTQLQATFPNVDIIYIEPFFERVSPS
jgi:hypothetical protein